VVSILVLEDPDADGADLLQDVIGLELLASKVAAAARAPGIDRKTLHRLISKYVAK
jgi:hypothetical protein